MIEKFRITLHGVTHEVEVERLSGAVSNPEFKAAMPAPAPAPAVAPVPKPAASAPVQAGAKTVNAPMPGKVLSVNVKDGDTAKRGDVLLILEAMKMANEIMAPQDCVISDVRAVTGQTVGTGDVLIVLGQ